MCVDLMMFLLHHIPISRLTPSEQTLRTRSAAATLLRIVLCHRIPYDRVAAVLVAMLIDAVGINKLFGRARFDDMV